MNGIRVNTDTDFRVYKGINNTFIFTDSTLHAFHEKVVQHGVENAKAWITEEHPIEKSFVVIKRSVSNICDNIQKVTHEELNTDSARKENVVAHANVGIF